MPETTLYSTMPFLPNCGKYTVHAGIHDLVITDLKVVAGLPHDGIALVFGDLEVLDYEVVARVEDGVVHFALSIKRSALTFFDHADKTNIVFIDINRLVIQPRHNANDRARLSGLDGLLDRFACV